MIEKTENGFRVTVPMLIANGRALLEVGRDFLRSRREKAAVLDLGAVNDVDSSGLAVIFGLLRSAKAQGVELRVANPPASLLSLAGLYGVSESLPLLA